LGEGAVEWIVSPDLDAAGILAYRRRLGDRVATVVVNVSGAAGAAPVPPGAPALFVGAGRRELERGVMPARTGGVWLN
jgi:hypothetical protein